MDKTQNLTAQGRIYGEVAAWITLLGMAVAAIGLVVSLIHGGGILQSDRLLRELLAGYDVPEIWRSTSTFAKVPPNYWFFEVPICGDEITMAGIVVACYGSVVGLVTMMGSIFQNQELLFHKKGLFTILAFVITTIMLLAATGVIALRH